MKWIYELLMSLIPVSDDNEKHLPHSRYKRLCLISVALPLPKGLEWAAAKNAAVLTRDTEGPIPWDYHPLVAYQHLPVWFLPARNRGKAEFWGWFKQLATLFSGTASYVRGRRKIVRSGLEFLELLNLSGPTGIEIAERYPRLEASTAWFGGLGSTVV